MSQPQFVSCLCQHCYGNIQFDLVSFSAENNVVDCPHCGVSTSLSIPSVATPFGVDQRKKHFLEKVSDLVIGRSDSDTVSNRARKIELLGRVFIVMGLFSFGFAFRGVIQNESDEAKAWVIFGIVGLTIAAILFFYAQIVYIRAALIRLVESESKPNP